jgi:predicted Zn finger-like uncharacterized protein
MLKNPHEFKQCMEGQRGFVSHIFLAGLLLCSVLSLPSVQASSGLILMQEATLNFDDTSSFLGNSTNVSFDLVEQNNSAGTVFVNATLLDLSGQMLWFENQSHSLSGNQVKTVLISLTDLDVGYMELHLELFGDIGELSNGFVSETTVSLQRISPSSIDFVGISAITLSGMDSLGQLTTNSTIRQGDYIQVEIPIENAGDVDGIESFVLDVGQETWNDTLHYPNILVNGTSTIVLEFQSTSMVTEGEIWINISMNESTSSLSLISAIGPPPLPNASIFVDIVTEDVIAGSEVSFNVTRTNLDGERSFDGFTVCNFEENEVLNQSTILSIDGETVTLITFIARPGILECMFTGDRNGATNSGLVTYTLEDLESAIFDGAGPSGLALIGGPWHVDDQIDLSLLLRNQGNISGQATLEVRSNLDVLVANTSITLEQGQAGDIALSFILDESGLQDYHWMIRSMDGIVSSGLNGTFSVEVSPEQAMFAEVVAIEAQGEVTIGWNVSIDNGVPRDVKLRYGYRVSGTDVFVSEQTITLGSGIVMGQTPIGEVPGSEVILRMSPVGWTASTSSYIASAPLSGDESLYSMSINPITIPRQIEEGSTATVTIDIENSGLLSGPTGEMLLIDSDGTILAQSTTSAMTAGSTSKVDLTFNVPSGAELMLTAQWTFVSTVLESEKSFTVEAKEIEEEGLEIPWVAIGGGIASSSAIILVLHLRRAPGSETGLPEKKKKETKKAAKKEVESVERTCPSCERKLRIPGDYSGIVRCPDCSERFDIEAEIEDEIELDEEFDDLELIETPPSKVEISCPECSSSLRVPSDYGGSVRCPSCSTVFSAKQNG